MRRHHLLKRLKRLNHKQKRGVSSKPWFLAEPLSIALLGAPQEMGQPLAGTARGPTLLRKAGLREMLTALRWRVEDLGDVAMPEEDNGDDSSMRHGTAVLRGARQLFETARTAHLKGQMVVCVGGDHSIALGTVAASVAARPDTRVLWVDAHADVHTPETSTSGNVHGMPLGFLLGLATHPLLDFLPLLEPKNLAYVGLRDVDAAEKPVLRKLQQQGTFVATMYDVDNDGIGTVMKNAFSSLGYENNGKKRPPLHLSYDVDAIDPLFAPATGTAVRGGLSFREAHFIAEAAFMTGALGSMDIVEVNDSLTDSRQEAEDTVNLAASLVASACGDAIL